MKLISTFSILIPSFYFLISGILLTKTFAADNKSNEIAIVSEPDLNISPKSQRQILSHHHTQLNDVLELERQDPYYHLHLPEKLRKALLEKGHPIPKHSRSQSSVDGLQEFRTGYVVPSPVHHKHSHTRHYFDQVKDEDSHVAHSPTFLNSDGLQQHQSGWAIHKPFSQDEDRNGDDENKKKEVNSNTNFKENDKIHHLGYLTLDPNSFHHSPNRAIHAGLGLQKHKLMSQKELDEYIENIQSPKKNQKGFIEQVKEPMKK